MNTNKENKILYKELSYKLQGLFYAIRNDIGSGHKESIYQKALEKELISAGIKFIKEPSIKIYSQKGEFLGLYRPDFLVEDKIIIELKAAERVSKQESARVYDYLRNSRYELAYLVNFASPRLYIKRLIFTNDRKPRIATNIKRIAANLIIFVAISSLFVGIRGVQAAELNLVSQTKEISITQQFQVDVILNTEGEEINAVEGKIIFPQDILEIKNINNGNSIINFWVEKPRLNNLHEIVFSGITPGGLNSEKGLILSMIWEARKEGQGIIEIRDVRVLKNDGAGTPAEVKISNFQFNIKGVGFPKEVQLPEVKDTEPPESFVPEVASDPTIFEGKWFLVFATQDKASGIDYYAVHESTRKRTRIDTKDWTQAESPYVLKDQKLRSYIYVKAVDKAGNERVVILPPKYPLKWYEEWESWVIIVLLVALIFYVVRKVLWKAYTKQH
jgi:GxxExxY protein